VRRLSNSFLVIAFYVGFSFIVPNALAAKSDDQSKAESKARTHLSKKGIKAEQLKSKDVISDETGNHVRFSQFINGVRVYGGEPTENSLKQLPVYFRETLRRKWRVLKQPKLLNLSRWISQI
jgi:Zn-dependent metalloprotease